MIYIKLEKNNKTVTDYYLHTIGEALSGIDKVTYFYDFNGLRFKKKEDIVVVSTAPDAFKLFLKRIKYVFWSQGVWPEESLMRHNSKLRFYICSLIEKKALKKSCFTFMVSETQKSFYEKKYKIDFSDNYYIMPCSNEEFHKENFSSDKYKKNVFVYAGGTSVWQCFEKTIELYSKIERSLNNTKLLLLVKDKNLALKYIKKYNVKNYEIDFVTVSELKRRIKDAKFGLIIREDSPVNYVATPTKALTYISNGIIPIYSKSLEGINGLLKNTKFKIVYNNNDKINDIISMANDHIDKENILKEFSDIYANNYEREKHIIQIREKIR